jgi:outer membrane immunogenic protein
VNFKILAMLLTKFNNVVLRRSRQTECEMKVRRWDMSKVLRAALACGALSIFAPSAFAQDNYPTDESYADASGSSDGSSSDTGWDYDWSGSYFGLSAAYAVGSHDTLGIGGIDTGSRDLSGAAFGGFAGHNYHISKIVIGTEMDFSKSSISGSFKLPGSLLACNGGGFSCGTDINWNGTMRARAGVPMGDFLPYATAGLAVAGVNTSFKGPGIDTKLSGLGLGWVLGVGIEYAVMKNLNIRAEALHYDLSDVTDTVLSTKVTTDAQFTVVRAGVSLKF